VGLQIATTHVIEVITPGACNEKASRIMFESYQGLEVLMLFQDSKTQKVKSIKGRNNKVIIINIKGSIKKFNNDMVISIKLKSHKAKKVKGVASKTEKRHIYFDKVKIYEPILGNKTNPYAATK
jgi:hypothetical protein